MKKLIRNLTLTAALCASLVSVAFGGPPAAAKGEFDVTGVVAAIAPMSSPRAAHTATLLLNGRVLVTGGMVRERAPLDSAELFDPATNTFSPVTPMHTPRVGHTATLLDDGRVLLAGGWETNRLASAEVYESATGAFTPVGDMAFARGGHTATLLENGQVLITGGTDAGQNASAELFDPAAGTFTTTGALNEERDGHTATRLLDGRVLIAGGDAVGADTVLRSVEIYDAHLGLFSASKDLMLRRRTHGAALLPDGRVLIVGGSDDRDWDGRHMTSEIFDPVRAAFVPGPAMGAPRFKISASVATLGNGQVFVAGDNNQATLFSLIEQQFYLVDGRVEDSFLTMTATPLNDGRVLMLGGYTPDIQATANAWLFTPDPVDD